MLPALNIKSVAANDALYQETGDEKNIDTVIAIRPTARSVYDFREAFRHSPVAKPQPLAAKIVAHMLIAHPALAPQVPKASAPIPYITMLASKRIPITEPPITFSH